VWFVGFFSVISFTLYIFFSSISSLFSPPLFFYIAVAWLQSHLNTLVQISSNSCCRYFPSNEKDSIVCVAEAEMKLPIQQKREVHWYTHISRVVCMYRAMDGFCYFGWNVFSSLFSCTSVGCLPILPPSSATKNATNRKRKGIQENRFSRLEVPSISYSGHELLTEPPPILVDSFTLLA
jgi:hypothetical protein